MKVKFHTSSSFPAAAARSRVEPVEDVTQRGSRHDAWLDAEGVKERASERPQMMRKVKLKARDGRLHHEKERRRKKKPWWQHKSWFIDFPTQFFSSRVPWKSKAICGFVGGCYIPSANGHGPQTHWCTTPCTNTRRSQRGGVFNPQIHCHKSNPAAVCPAASLSMKSSSQWHINSNLQRQPSVHGEEHGQSVFYFVILYHLHQQHSHWITVWLLSSPQ